uniref:DDE_Tnp_1_7 domain-containing protein n=1 Tax=Ascaris lumbricoides TaxID=6252 RepID=A0A0M3I526_ASCLU
MNLRRINTTQHDTTKYDHLHRLGELHRSFATTINNTIHNDDDNNNDVVSDQQIMVRGMRVYCIIVESITECYYLWHKAMQQDIVKMQPRNPID